MSALQSRFSKRKSGAETAKSIAFLMDLLAGAAKCAVAFDPGAAGTPVLPAPAY